MDSPGQRVASSRGHEVCVAVDGIAKNDGDRSFTFSVAPDPCCGSSLVVHRARMLAAARCPRTLQRALHELVARSRQRASAEDHAAALTRSSWSRVPYPLRRCLEIFDVFARSFGCVVTRGSAGCAFVRTSARSDDGASVFVRCGADAGRAGASRRVAGAAACTESAGRLADFVDSWPASTRAPVAAPVALWTTTPSLVVTVAAAPSVSTWTSTAKMVPRTDAVG